MGCWNETCAFSRLAITAGEPVRFLPIVMNAWHCKPLSGHPDTPPPAAFEGSSGCYVTDLWTPYCLPLKGLYSDYGSIEDIPEDTAADKALVAQFHARIKRDAIPLKLGSNSCHDTDVSDLADFATVLEALQEGRLYVKRRVTDGKLNTSLPLPVSWMMVKESVWQAMLDVDLMDLDHAFMWKGNGADKKPTVERSTKRYAAALKGLASQDRFEQLHAAMDRVDGMFSHSPERSPIYEGSELGYDPTPLAAAAAELDYVHLIASDLRITFHPTTGSGSQSSNLDLWSKVSKRWIKDDVAREKASEL